MHPKLWNFDLVFVTCRVASLSKFGAKRQWNQRNQRNLWGQCVTALDALYWDVETWKFKRRNAVAVIAVAHCDPTTWMLSPVDIALAVNAHCTFREVRVRGIAATILSVLQYKRFKQNLPGTNGVHGYGTAHAGTIMWKTCVLFSVCAGQPRNEP